MSAASLIKAVYRAVDAAIAGLVDGQEVVPSVDDHGNLRVAVTNSTDRTSTGTINETTPGVGKVTYVEIVSQGCGTVGADIRTANFNGTLIFEATVDGTNWETIPATAPTTGAEVTSIALVGAAYSELWVVPCAGYGKVRVRCSAYAAGTVVVSLEASSAGQDVSLANPLPVGDNLVGRVKISDGTTVGRVQPASTAAAYADPAQTVDVRPGGVFPAGAAPADAVTNATTMSAIGAWLAGFNGTTWDRVRAGVTGAIAATTGVLNTLGISKFNSTKPSLLDTQATEFQATARGALLTANDEPSQFDDPTNRVAWFAARPLADGTAGNILTWVDTLAGNGAVGKASPGRLYALYGTTVTGRFIQLHNATAAPGDGAVPVFSIWVPANSVYNFTEILELYGRYCSTGIYVCASSTHGTKTLSVTADTDIHQGVA